MASNEIIPVNQEEKKGLSRKAKAKTNVETPPDTTPETSQVHDETPLRQADTELAQHGETTEDTEKDIENTLNPIKINDLLHLRLDKKLSLRAISEKSGFPLATISRILKGVGLQEDFSEPAFPDAEPETEVNDTPELEGEVSDSHSRSPSSVSSLPEGYFPRAGLTPEEWKELSSLDKPKLMSKVAELKAANSSLQVRAHLSSGNGDGHGSSLSFYDEEMKKLEVEHQKILNDQEREYASSLREQKMRDRVGNRGSENLTEDKIERIVERAIQRSEKGDPVEKALETVGKLYSQVQSSQSHQETQNPYQIAQNILTLTKEQAQFAHGTTNEFDLKNTELKSLAKLEEQKLLWEMQKYADEKQSGSETINAIKEVLAGPIGGLLGKFGEAGVDRIRGAGSKIPTVDVLCPNCAAKFKANPELDPVQCPKCGVMLQKNPPVAQKTVEETEPLQNPEPKITTIPKPAKLRDETVDEPMDNEVKKLYE